MTLPELSFSDLRLRVGNRKPVDTEGDYVLYWMTAARRSGWNFALQRAIEAAGALEVGLIVCEPLRCDEAYASDRLHRFAVAGMRDTAAGFADTPIRYYPRVEAEPGEDRGLLQALAEAACLVVTDHLPHQLRPELAAELDRAGIPVRLEAIDGHGLLPLSLPDRDYPTAHGFRRLLHEALPAFLDDRPRPAPLQGRKLRPAHVPQGILARWPAADPAALLAGGIDQLPIDHGVGPAPQPGGSLAAGERLAAFLAEELADYPEQRNVPDADATSRLSTYLHFGHISSHEIFSRLAEQEGWDNGRLALKPTGKRNGWWGMSEAAEAFLDELVTWRELGYLFCQRRDDAKTFAGLPDWARATLDAHRGDRRTHCYDQEEFAAAATHDPLWNAAQRQLRCEGRIHGYLRMLWGKKILEWTPDPQTALEVMTTLNDRYALDGRDPNSYSGIGWCLGRFDRAWGPEREVFGKIRYMTSANTRRKTAVDAYLERYAAETG